MRGVRRTAASLWLAAVLLVVDAGAAEAALTAGTVRIAGAITSATWRLDARLDPSDPPSGLPLSATGLSTRRVLYFSLVNFGTLDIVAATFTVDVSKGNSQTVAVTLRTCGGVWDEALDTCSGAPAVIFQAGFPSATGSAAVPIPAGASARVQVESNLPGTAVTISVAVSSGTPREIRPVVDGWA